MKAFVHHDADSVATTGMLLQLKQCKVGSNGGARKMLLLLLSALLPLHVHRLLLWRDLQLMTAVLLMHLGPPLVLRKACA